MNDCVWTVNHHPSLCGTAKFSHLLAKKLGIPCVPFGTPSYRYPLISVRASEIEAWRVLPSKFDLFWHDLETYHEMDEQAFGSIQLMTRLADRVYAANVDIANKIRAIRPDVIEAWAPSTIQGNPTRGAFNVLTFGMAHKIQTPYYEKLKTLLDATRQDYTVSVSTAVHEGSPWDETAKVGDKLRVVFGDRLRVLGYLADDALARELLDCSAVAVFYDPALRANNTSFWAAYDAWVPIMTNLDEQSPRDLAHGVFNINDLDKWPERMPINRYHRGRTVDSWDGLLTLMGATVPV